MSVRLTEVGRCLNSGGTIIWARIVGCINKTLARIRCSLLSLTMNKMWAATSISLCFHFSTMVEYPSNCEPKSVLPPLSRFHCCSSTCMSLLGWLNGMTWSTCAGLSLALRSQFSFHPMRPGEPGSGDQSWWQVSLLVGPFASPC